MQRAILAIRKANLIDLQNYFPRKKTFRAWQERQSLKRWEAPKEITGTLYAARLRPPGNLTQQEPQGKVRQWNCDVLGGSWGVGEGGLVVVVGVGRGSRPGPRGGHFRPSQCQSPACPLKIAAPVQGASPGPRNDNPSPTCVARERKRDEFDDACGRQQQLMRLT